MLTATAGAWRVRRSAGLKGFLTPPGDKSVSNRAVILGALASGTSRIEGWLPSDDCLRTLEIFRRLGAGIERDDGDPTRLRITGRGIGGLTPPTDGAPLECGESGTTMRLTLGVLAGHAFEAVLTGGPALSRRPMRRVVDPLRAMGAAIAGEDGGEHAPLRVRGGPLKGIVHEMPVASGMVKSALLLAGLHAEGVTRVRQPAPTRDHTERQLTRLGARCWAEDDGWRCVEGRPAAGLRADAWRIPGDLSAAAFFLVAAAILPRSEIELRRVGINATRAGVLDVLRRMGANLSIVNEREEDGEPVADLIVKGGAPLKSVRIGGDLVPRLIDEIPVLAVAACFADGVTVIRDAGELRVKESDRLAAMAAELGKLGARVGVLPDGLAIEGGGALRGAVVDAHDDHRVAMALAVAGLALEGETVVEGSASVTKSYPGFAADLTRLAAA